MEGLVTIRNGSVEGKFFLVRGKLHVPSVAKRFMLDPSTLEIGGGILATDDAGLTLADFTPGSVHEVSGPAAGAAAGPSAAAAVTTTPKKVIKTVYDMPRGGPAQKSFKSQEDFEKWLGRQDFYGLLSQQGPPMVVDDFDQLVTGESYLPVPKDTWRERVSGIEASQRHLGMRREQEFGEGLRGAVAAEEQVALSDVELLPEARLVLAPDGSVLQENDAVVAAKTAKGTVVYIGSHKTYTDSLADVQLAVGRAFEAEKLARDPIRQASCPDAIKAATSIKPAFMAEWVGRNAATRMLGYCLTNKVLWLKRSSGGIVRVHHKPVV